MIEQTPFGTLSDGTVVTCYRLYGGGGACVNVLDYGATIQSILVPDRHGLLTDVVLGYDHAADYARGTFYFGATVGRHANRIGGGNFSLNGVTYRLETNSGPNHAHGGFSGYDKRMFRGEVRGDRLRMRLVSPDGDQGYPGRLTLTVTFTFSPFNALRIEYFAETDKDTVVNLTNHSYFDLSSGRDPMGQLLRLRAKRYTENDGDTLPTGVIADVRGTPFDFTAEKSIGRDLGQDHIQLKNCRGYDHNFVLERPGNFAWLRSPATGIAMTAATDMPGVQLYSGNWVRELRGKRPYGPRSGVCLETQFFPNAMGLKNFRKPILRAGEVYDHWTEYWFGNA